MLRNVACEKLEILALAHISSECNTIALAKNTALAALKHCGCTHTSVIHSVDDPAVYEV